MLVPVTAACILAAAQFYSLPVPIIYSIMDVEGGAPGTVSRNTNGSTDHGIMHVNSIHIPAIAEMTNKSRNEIRDRLTNDGCYNVAIGAWLLSSRIHEARDFWTGVAHYHSRTPKYGFTYMSKVIKAATRLFGDNVFRGGRPGPAARRSDEVIRSDGVIR
jgi:hypothetical protein